MKKDGPVHELQSRLMRDTVWASALVTRRANSLLQTPSIHASIPISFHTPCTKRVHDVVTQKSEDNNNE
jgi:hypothetical protein